MPRISNISRRAPADLWGTAAKAVRQVLFCAALLSGLSLSSAGNAMVVGPGEAFQIDFSFSAAPVIPGGVDGLALTAGGTTSSGPGIPVNVALFDGSTLLGAGDGPFSALTAFVAPFSLFNGITANLDTVIDGTIDGQIRITPDFPGGSGFLNFGTATLVIQAFRGTSPTGVALGQQFATIESTSVVSATPPVSEIPLPAALPLLLSALGVWGLIVWRWVRRNSTSR